jgi:3-oxoacyl-[acyl-carrier protein] reductase
MPRTALVTGGSGAVGSAIVRRMAADGFNTAFTYHKNADSAKGLQEETGATAFQVDLCEQERVEEMVQSVVGTFGGIDVLVNNAGATQVMPFALIEEEDWDAIMNANLKTMFLTTHESVRTMIRQKSGVVVNIGSLAGHRILEVPVHYAAAKAAVTGFTLALAKELARYNVRVNEVVPGLLEAGVGDHVPEKERADYLAHCAAGRAGRTAEVAATVAFLASEDATYINGQSIFVDGGI